MTNPINRNRLSPEDIKREQEQAASTRLQELVARRLKEAPAVPHFNDDGTLSSINPEDLYNQEGSTGAVLADDGSGGAQKVGVQEYATGDYQPLDPSGLRQDFNDAKGGNDTSSLDKTVRNVDRQWYARNKGEDTAISPEEVDFATSDQDLNNDGAIELGSPESGYTPANDADTNMEMMRLNVLRNMSQPEPEPEPSREKFPELPTKDKDKRFSGMLSRGTGKTQVSD